MKIIENIAKGVIILKIITILLVICFFLFGCASEVTTNEVNDLKSLTENMDQTEETTNVSKNAFPLTIEDYIFDDFSKPEEVQVEDKKLYYLALGDSLTRGVGDEEHKNGYTKRLAEKLEQWTNISEVILDNRGKRGRRSDQLLALLEKGHYDSELRDSELITLTIGGNDIMKVVKQDLFELEKEAFDKELIKFRERYDQIMEEIRLRNPDVPIIVIGLYNPFSMITDEITDLESIITEWNQTIEDISNQYENACFVDVEDLFDSNANLVYHTDFFHPNGYGYTIMTERIVSMMKSCHIEEQSDGLILFD